MKIDGELILGLQQKNPKSQQQFWNALFQPVFAICAKIIGPGPVAVDTATDLLNDFIFHYVHNLSNPAGAWSYLKMMAIRRSIRERQRTIKKEPFDEQTISTDATEFSIAELSILMPKIVDCLHGLTPKAQSIIRLKYKKGLPNDQIGGIVGGSKQYIGRLIQKSLLLLRDCLDQKEKANV